MFLWLRSFHVEHEFRKIDIAPTLINHELKFNTYLSCIARSLEEGCFWFGAVRS